MTDRIIATEEIRRNWREVHAIRDQIKPLKKAEKRHLDAMKAYLLAGHGKELYGGNDDFLAEFAVVRPSIDWKSYAIALGATEEGAKDFMKPNSDRFLIK